MTGSSPGVALPYKQPGITLILSQGAFIILLNLFNHLLNNLVYCGLVGQVVIGVAWGTPGAKWLTPEAENIIVELGYIGLILLVFEGGLSTSFPSLKANVLLSTGVAVTGICLPIALSFSLRTLAMATPLQAFAAGAALCSTSLGTTFTVLSTCSLTKTRLGTVLTSAAMMDDVIGLIMVQVISNLGASDSSLNSIDVVRPIAVSIALIVVLLLFCQLCVKPTTALFNKWRTETPSWRLKRICQSRRTALALHTTILVCLVAGASFAGTSNLFAAYLAGVSISWWDSEVEHPEIQQQQAPASHPDCPNVAGCNSTRPLGTQNFLRSNEDSRTEEPNQNFDTGHHIPDQGQCRPAQHAHVNAEANVLSMLATVSEIESYNLTGTAIYGRYYLNVVEKLLKPFFFASIGFSIPISLMFHGTVVWRGIVYTLLMLLAKLLTGLWLVRFTTPSITIKGAYLPFAPSAVTGMWLRTKEKLTANAASTSSEEKKASDSAQADSIPMRTIQTPQTTNTVVDNQSNFNTEPPKAPQSAETAPQARPQPGPTSSKKPLSLYPASILGAAMIARGEIGFLIASIAESNGIFASSQNDEGQNLEIYLVVVWAIVLCTIIGPLSVGVLVKRVKRLQRGQSQNLSGATDPLGAWGIA